MFSGIMSAERLATILEEGLIPFIEEKFNNCHRLFQGNDPKHASQYIEDFFACNNNFGLCTHLASVSATSITYQGKSWPRLSVYKETLVDIDNIKIYL